MSKSLQTAAAGMQSMQQRIDVLADNIANVNTQGFKKSRAEFAELVHTALQNPARPQDNTTNLQTGTGAALTAIQHLFSNGPLLETARPLDFALIGNGFFAVEQPDGRISYTRDGNFQSREIDGLHCLCTSAGQPVLGEDGQRLISPEPFETVSADSTGALSVQGWMMGRIARFDFANPAGLESAGGNSFFATEASGQARAAATEVRQGFIEGSNVDLTEEMTGLIRAQRAYSLLGRAVSTVDQMRATANEIRR